MRHHSSYIICATPRSGSTFLCDLFRSMGVAGNPDSYFRMESYGYWADYLKVASRNWTHSGEFNAEYLSTVIKEGSGGTSVFGMRLMWESLGDLSRRLDELYPSLSSDKARLDSAFSDPLYVYLSRENKLAQAVSHLKAEQSGLWHIYADGTERERIKPGDEPQYDYDTLKSLVETHEQHDARWLAWFDQQEIQPIKLIYESLVVDPQDSLAPVIDALGLDNEILSGAKPISAKLGDQVSEQWIKRYQEDTNVRLVSR